MQIPVIQSGFPCGASALTCFHLVKTPTAVVVSGSAGEAILGVVQNNPTGTSQTASVMIIGRTSMIANAAIAALAKLASAGNGKVRTAQSGDTVIGMALTAASNDGDLFDGIVNTPGGEDLT
jgi:hypothetical protein